MNTKIIHNQLCIAYPLIYRESNFKSSYLLNKASHQQKLYIEKILSGALLNISSYTRLPYFRHTWQAVEGQCKIINYQHGVLLSACHCFLY